MEGDEQKWSPLLRSPARSKRLESIIVRERVEAKVMCVDQDDPWKVHFILNSKGGVGKSFIAFLLAQYYRQRGKRPSSVSTPMRRPRPSPALPL
jgi:Mrp family chromosome partitioning ATPase